MLQNGSRLEIVMPSKIMEIVGKLNEKKHSFRNSSAITNSDVSKFNLIDNKTPFSINEAYKATRTNIMFSLAGEDRCKKVIFTSAEPGEGKSTTILNVAITFAQMDAKVLIIDGDLRKPRVHRYLNLEKNDGLSDLLAGMITVDKAIKHHEEYRLDCITAGQIPPNPIELLSSDKMGELLQKLSESYDYIFIDTPPVTVVTDALSLAKFVDGYILLVRHNYSIHELLERTRQSLEFAEAKILGYIINDIKPMAGIGYSRYGAYSSRYKYRYRYRYGYKYGYNYSYGYGYGYGYGYQYADRRNNIYSDEYVYGDDVEYDTGSNV